MKINLTKEEYQTLLEMIYLSDWVLHAFTSDSKDENKNHKILQKKLLALHKEIQAEDLLAQFQSNEFDEYMHANYLEKYNENVFWEMLIDQLAFRDLTKKIGMDAFNKLDPLEKIEKIEVFREKYAKEFEKNQLDNVKITT